ncbi:ABC transporter [Kitasatospora cheerisanensis KCTC 2395]|uniref:ABC transporter n=1 Tax=Kitasatospora cheerisanensis KCTC 2395 TaxID=1348663 RepID=A0A066YLI0_9ACTN|nr:ABC transporter [Kitasatospora cheerisanensis KCTC 2395]
MPAPRKASGPAVSAIGLRKSYGDKTVLDGIDLTIPAGTVFALLGPNGAGKTTTVEILSTLVGADAGQAQIAGHDLAADPDGVRSAIGVTGQFAALDDMLTAEENLLLMADLLRLPAPEAAPGYAGVAAALRHRGRRGQARRDLLRRDAPPARPGDDPGRRPGG